MKPGAPIARSVVGVLAGDSPPRAVEEVARALAASGAQIVSGGRAGPAATPASRRETHSGDSDATLDGSLRWWDTERAWEIDGPVQPDVFVRPRSGARSHPVLGVADAERIAELEHTLSAYDRARRTRSVARPRCYVVASRHAGLTRRFLGRSRAWEELAGNEITVFRERVEGQRVVAFAAVGTNGSVRTGSLLERRESGELVVLADPDPVVRAAVSRTARSFLEAVRAWAERNREEWRAPRLWRLDMVVRGDSALLVGGAAPPEVEATRPVLDLLTRDVLPGLYSAS